VSLFLEGECESRFVCVRVWECVSFLFFRVSARCVRFLSLSASCGSVIRFVAWEFFSCVCLRDLCDFSSLGFFFLLMCECECDGEFLDFCEFFKSGES